MLSDTLIGWSAGVSIESMAKDCPPTDTRLRATVCQDQMGGREIVGRSIGSVGVIRKYAIRKYEIGEYAIGEYAIGLLPS